MSTYSIKNRPADMGGSNAEIKKSHVIQMGIILLLTFLLVGCGAGKRPLAGMSHTGSVSPCRTMQL